MGKNMHCARAKLAYRDGPDFRTAGLCSRTVPWLQAKLIIFARKGYSDIQEQTPWAIEELEPCIS